MLDFWYHVFAYATVFSLHTRHSLPMYLHTFAKPNRIPITLHFSAGLIEVFKYQTLVIRGPVYPSVWDLFLCLCHSLSSIQLNKTLRRGNITTRPTYQIVALWRLYLSTAAWTTQDAHLHWASVRMIDSFLYTRAIVFLAYVAHFDRRFSGGDLYGNGVFFAGLLSVWEIDLTCGLPLFLLLVAGQMWLIDFVSRNFRQVFDLYF